ncbi:MAG: dienelactone hydrolase family protein [Acidimicrobiales bacterium]
MRITLPSDTPVELARPTSGSPDRGLVVAADIGGLRPLFDDMARRLADEQGWVVGVVEPFPGLAHLAIEERTKDAGGVADDRRVGDLVAGADALDVEPVGLIGFCMGGMYTLKAAATGRFDRCVAFYGMIRVPENWQGPGQGEPLDALEKRGDTDVMAIIGTADRFTPPDDVDALEAQGVTVVRYEGAEHGFVHDPARPAHRPDDAADAWRRAIDFLRH